MQPYQNLASIMGHNNTSDYGTQQLKTVRLLTLLTLLHSLRQLFLLTLYIA